MINILYIHGLDSSPKPEKIEVLKQYGRVVGLHLDYKKEENPFKLLNDTILNENISHIVGSSLGGFLGFWLGEKNSLPCLLFNPALGMRSIDVQVERNYNKCPKRLIVLGEQDDVVLPYHTIEFLRPFSRKKTQQEIIIDSTMEHRISDENFVKYVRYFFN